MSAPGTIQQQFESFHEQNPLVYQELVRLARQLITRGYASYSIDALFHVVRWHEALVTKSDDLFRLNNNFTSRYTRLIETQEPDLKGFFRSRMLKAA